MTNKENGLELIAEAARTAPAFYFERRFGEKDAAKARDDAQFVIYEVRKIYGIKD